MNSIFSLPLENKIHIFVPPYNILYIIKYKNMSNLNSVPCSFAYFSCIYFLLRAHIDERAITA